MTISHAVRHLRQIARVHGVSASLNDIAVRALNKLLYYRKLQCVVIEDVAPKYYALPEGFSFSLVSPSDLMKIAESPEYEMTLDFVEAALAKGDTCYGIWKDAALASYGWYSHVPTALDNERLSFRFDPWYVYMYKGFTLDAYRGKRLHAIGITRALAAYRQGGFSGLVSYVESNNFDSLRSCDRMGFSKCGCIEVLGIGGHYRVRHEKSCAKYGLDLRVCPPERPERTRRAVSA